MIIDAHQHFWKYDPRRDTWITEEMSVLRRDFLPEDLLTELRSNKVDGCIAVQADQSEQETLFLLDLTERHPEIQGVVGWVDLRASNLKERLQYFSPFQKLRGFRHIVQSEPDARFMLRDDFCLGIEMLQQFHFTYDILIYPKQLAAALELVRRFPAQRFVVDHMAKPPIHSRELEPWAEQMRQIATHANVWCKLSGLITEAAWRTWKAEDFQPYLGVVLERFGPDRLMFGSDWPVCLVSGSYSQVKALVTDAIAHFSAEQQKKIFGLNAISFYGLTGSHGLAAER
jgi:L-fuconolactonase